MSHLHTASNRMSTLAISYNATWRIRGMYMLYIPMYLQHTLTYPLGNLGKGSSKEP